MRPPRIELGSPRPQRGVLPLNQRRSVLLYSACYKHMLFCRLSCNRSHVQGYVMRLSVCHTHNASNMIRTCIMSWDLEKYHAPIDRYNLKDGSTSQKHCCFDRANYSFYSLKPALHRFCCDHRVRTPRSCEVMR